MNDRRQLETEVSFAAEAVIEFSVLLTSSGVSDSEIGTKALLQKGTQ